MPQYQGVWNLAQQSQALTRQQWVTDPLFNSTTLLLQADNAANGAQNNAFLDSSSNAFAITRNGNTTQGTFSPFSQSPGWWSNYFNGSSAYLQVPDNASFEIGSGNFTVEAWIFLTGYSPTYSGSGAAYSAQIINKDDNAARSYNVQLNGTASSWTSLAVTLFSNNTTAVATSASYSFSLNTWYHIAIVRNGTSVRIYVNGVDIGGGTNSTAAQDTSAAVQVGAQSPYWAGAGYGYYFPGYISNIRLVKGAAVYTSNFTPSTTPLGVYSSGTTALLTCQSNRFIDNGNGNSGAAFTVTPNNTSVQAFSPFAPQYQYDPLITGASAYFDGTGDYLTPPAAAIPTGAGTAFTIEAWIYPTALGFPIVGIGTTGNYIDFYAKSDGSLVFDIKGTTSVTSSAAGVIKLNQWSHVALTRTTGNLYTLYLNGVSVGTPTVNSTSLSSSSSYNLCNGTGYASGLRIANSLVYTGNFNVPTAPPTNITNTSLLLNFTNAGIYDGTLKNCFETVGNAQVSTNVVKYGSGSMYFNGTTDYLVAAPNPWQNFNTGDFTIEAWIYPTVAGTERAIVSKWNNYSTNQSWLVELTSANVVILYISTTGTDLLTVTGTRVIPINTWTHVAVTKQNNVFSIWINGVLDVTGTNSTALFSANNTLLSVGRYYNSNTSTNYAYWPGYIDDLRITKGIARYTRNFTPPQVALPRQ